MIDEKKKEYTERRDMIDRLKKIREIIEKENLDAVLVSTSANITYLTNFEFSIVEDREAFLIITSQNQYIISSFLYKQDFEKIAPEFIFLEISSATRKSFSEHFKDICEKEKLKIVGFEENNLTQHEYSLLSKNQAKLMPLDIGAIRSIKDRDEIDKITKACRLGDKAFSYILNKIKIGMTEKDLAFLLETFIRENGADISFPSIICFGENAAVPHHKTDNTHLSNNQFVLMDFGAKLDNYCSDMTRTIFIGKPNKEDKKIYQTVLDAQKSAIEYLSLNNISVNASDVDKIARDIVVKNGFLEFPHSLGHSLGILVHDGFRLSPVSKTILTQGCVFSVEPGIYLPHKTGVRIEDIVAITKNGLEILTKSPKELTTID